jgi:hypothetical protein
VSCAIARVKGRAGHRTVINTALRIPRKCSRDSRESREQSAVWPIAELATNASMGQIGSSTIKVSNPDPSQRGTQGLYPPRRCELWLLARDINIKVSEPRRGTGRIPT